MSRIPILARRTILAAFITLAGSLLLLQGCGGGGGGGGGVTTPPGSSLPALWLAANNGTTGVELYRSDGTAAGTTLVNEIPGSSGVVINSGTINASLGGNVALIGKRVENNGLIVANLGTVTLAAGKQAVLTFDSGGLLGVRVSQVALS